MSIDTVRLSTDLARSVLFDHPDLQKDSMTVEKWIFILTQSIPIDPPTHGVSATIFGVLEQVAIEECEKIRIMSIVYYHQFPRFAQANNSLPLFLVACQSISISSKFTELLHDWAMSTDGIKIYHHLLETNKDAGRPDELMLSLSALAVFQSMWRGTQHDSEEPLERVRLIDVNRLLTRGNPCPSDRAIIRQMVWSFLHAVMQVLPTDAYPPFVRFLDPALAAVGNLEQHLHGVLEHYWMKRLRYSLSNAHAMAGVWKDVQSVPSPDKPSMEYVKNEKQSVIVDSKTGDETSNHSASTRADHLPLVKQIRENGNVHNPQQRSSSMRLGTFFKGLGFGICGERRADQGGAWSI
ncbi:MAG: hypothetical protein Q9217_002145 [Psora testacea]